jgi:LacI family transcriptional regulator
MTTAHSAVTLADVARRARVSLATASRVINATAKPVSDELRARVLKAVDDLQYVPNSQARMLARSELGSVGVIVHDVSDPYFAEITRGLQRVAVERGTLLVICNSYRDPTGERDYVEMLRAHRAAALVLAGSGYHDADGTRLLNHALRAYERGGGRVALIGRHTMVGAAVQPDNTGGARQAGGYLFGLGHRHVGVVLGPQQLTTCTDRLAGFRAGARTHGRSIPARLVAEADFTRDGGFAAAGALLDAAPEITALYAMNDAMAIGVLAAARQRGLRVPEDLSVMGFDDIPIARDVTPALTTVRLPLVEMGERALTLALDGRDPPVIETAPASLVIRGSTGPPRAAA